MKTLLGGFVVLVTLCWAQARGANPTPAPYSLWVLREDALYLSGLLSIALMSLAMVLATRPAPLEKAFNGMDKVYRTHKWAGILAVAFAAAHWLVEMSGDLIKALVGRSGRLPKEHLGGFLDILRDLAKDLGEWAIYAAIAMLAITLWKRFPF
ncbi:MAG: ferric reductase-like transmembrane domain-containing protein, partial [Rhodocyclaceae bacterium]|nr:ferric reductase-like transmembrane domain-containing protein [Rhodocyclaceae bacterium]